MYLCIALLYLSPWGRFLRTMAAPSRPPPHVAVSVSSGETVGVLVIGEAGSGKTTFISNLLGESLSQDCDSSASSLTVSRGAVKSTSVTVYDASGLESARTAWEKICNGEHDKWVVVFCIPLTETRMRASLIHTFKEYHDLGINWSKTVFALTFADAVPIPKSVKRDPNYNPARYFNQRAQEWEDHIRKVFHEQICGNAIAAVKMFPTTGDSGDELPNGLDWFDSAWSSMMITASRDPACTYILQDDQRARALLLLLAILTCTWLQAGVARCYKAGRVLVVSVWKCLKYCGALFDMQVRLSGMGAPSALRTYRKC